MVDSRGVLEKIWYIGIVPFVGVNQAIFYSTKDRRTDQFEVMDFMDTYNDCPGPLGEQFSDSVLTDAFYIWWLSYILEILTPVEHVNFGTKGDLDCVTKGSQKSFS